MNDSFLQTDMIILYMLDGEMNVCSYGNGVRLRKEDILLINPGVEYEINGIKDAIYAVASFSIGIISQILEGKSMMLYADSVRDPHHSYRDLRDILQEMTAEYIMHTHKSHAIIDSLMLRLLDCLIENYQVTQGQIDANENDMDARMQQIMQYIISHIHEEINLSELANEMYVSTSTLSRVFKKSTGIYFAEYVMRMRVRTSLELLRNSNQNMIQVAMNCGFSTSAAFNRSFKKVTGMMPSEYRKKYKISDSTNRVDMNKEQDIREELRKKGYQYSSQEHAEKLELNLEERKALPYKPAWNQCINVGDFYELSRANIQFHVLYLQEQLQYKYVRVWNIFSDKMMVSDGKTFGQYNFDFICQVLDFLIAHHLKPFIEMGRRPDTAIRNHGDEVYYQEEYISFASRELWEDLLSAFLTEIVSRYGLEEVSTWIFELDRDFHSSDSKIYEDDHYDFFHAWKFVFNTVREKAPGALFGGISTALESDRLYASAFYRRCVEEGYIPDYVSFFLYSQEIKRSWERRRTEKAVDSEESLEKAFMREIKEFMLETGIDGCRLFISEWNNSIGNRNFLNDSCFRAAYFVSKTIDLLGEADMMVPMAGTDWVSNYIDTNKLLNGGVGLLTKDRIGKPAFYALSFLNHMGTQFLAKGKRYLITKKENGDLYILCHNFSDLRKNAFTSGDSVDLEKVRQVSYEDERILGFDFLFQKLQREGEYSVKKRSLNNSSGSVLDEWGKLGYEAKMSREDIKYLQAISVPRIEIERKKVSSDGKLRISVKLEPQEVVLLHIYKV